MLKVHTPSLEPVTIPLIDDPSAYKLVLVKMPCLPSLAKVNTEENKEIEKLEVGNVLYIITAKQM